MAIQTGTVTAPAQVVAARVYTPGTITEIAVATAVTPGPTTAVNVFFTITWNTVPPGQYRMHLLNSLGQTLYVLDLVTFTATTWAEVPAGVTVQDITTAFGPGPYGSGPGPTPVTVNVDIEDVGPYAGAIISILDSNGDLVIWGTGNGGKTFTLHPGDYTAALTNQAGYAPVDPVPFTVPDDATVSIVVAVQSITPSDPGLVTGYWVCRNKQGQLWVGVTVKRSFAETRLTGVGLIHETTEDTVLSDSQGVAVFENLTPGALYNFQVGDGPIYAVRIPTDDLGPIPLTDLMGTPNA